MQRPGADPGGRQTGITQNKRGCALSLGGEYKLKCCVAEQMSGSRQGGAGVPYTMRFTSAGEMHSTPA